MKKVAWIGTLVVLLNLSLSVDCRGSDDLRALPSGTIIRASVDYAILANSRCLVLTEKQYDYGFDFSECTGLFHQEKEATCLLEYDPNERERKLSGFRVLRPYSLEYVLGGVYRGDQRTDGVAAFSAISLAGKSRFNLVCRSAGGKGKLSFVDLKKVLSPYFSLEMPAPDEF